MAGHLRSLRTPAVSGSASKSPERAPSASTDHAKEFAHSSGRATRTAHEPPNSRHSNKKRGFPDPTSRKKHPGSTRARRVKPQLQNFATPDERGQASSTEPVR